MRLKKSALILIISSLFLGVSNAEFNAIIGIEGKIATKIGTEYRNYTSWVDSGSQYNCTAWSPDATTIDYGEVQEQTQDCSQNQTRTKDLYTLYNTGAAVYEKTETENQTISETNKQNVTGTRNYEVSTSSTTGSWTNNGSYYSCTSWSPSTGSVNSGTRFTQTRLCYQNQRQLVTTYSHWADGSVTTKSTHYNNQTLRPQQSQTATGTKVTTGRWVKISEGSLTYGCTGTSALSGTCTNVGSRVVINVSHGYSSGAPVCKYTTYECRR